MQQVERGMDDLVDDGADAQVFVEDGAGHQVLVGQDLWFWGLGKKGGEKGLGRERNAMQCNERALPCHGSLL